MKIKDDDKRVSEFPQFTDRQWKEIVSYVLFGIPKQDSKGHSGHLSVRLQPATFDKIQAIKETFPHWYKNNSEAYRAIIATGIYVILHIAEQSANVDEEKTVLYQLNQIAKYQKFEQLQREFQQLRKGVLESEDVDEAKVIQMNMLKKLESRILGRFEK